LASLETDLALIFEPIRRSDFQTIATTRQAVYCCMAETHELASLDSIRLHHLLDVPVILPTMHSGIRQLLNVGLMRRNMQLATMLETDSQEFTQNYLRNEQVVGFQIPIGLPQDMAEGRPVNGLIARPIDSVDVPQGTLHIGHLRGRVLPVAAAKFMDLMITELGDRFPKDLDQ
jgi:DNA-binding transcriptional LysR family regulator